MPSLDERREVAARLREAPVGIESIECLISKNIGLDCDEDCDGLSYQDCEAQILNRLADLIEPEPIDGETSDGYHTFNELYHHRAVLFSVIVRSCPDMCWKSKKHHAGDMYEGMFIVGIDTPDGQASYHYDIDPYWDMFDCEEREFAPEWDGHTPEQAIERIGKLTCREPEERTCRWTEDETGTHHGECGLLWEFFVGGIGDNGVIFCPNCGAKVVGE